MQEFIAKVQSRIHVFAGRKNWRRLGESYYYYVLEILTIFYDTEDIFLILTANIDKT